MPAGRALVTSAPCDSDCSSPRAGGWTSSASSPPSSGRSCAASPSTPTRGRGSRSGSTTTSTPCPSRRERGDARGVDADGRVRRGDQPGPARPDVHLHGLPQPRLPREGRRDRRRHLRGRVEMGIGGRLVRARVARLRLRLPAAGERLAPLARASRSSADLWTTGTRDAARASTTRSTARSCQPRPLQGTPRPAGATASRCGSPAAARRRPCGSPRSTPTTPTSTARPRGSRTRARSCAGHCADVGRDFDEIVRSANYNVVIGETEAEVAGPAATGPAT